MMELAGLAEAVRGKEEIAIYGAGIVAYGLYAALEQLFKARTKYFIVSETKDNPLQIAGCPVMPLSEVSHDLEGTLVFIAVPEVYHKQIRGQMGSVKVGRCIYVDSHLEFLLMSGYYNKIGKFSCVTPNLMEETQEPAFDTRVYVARSRYDTKLWGRPEYPGWTKDIQAGAALDGKMAALLNDMEGENISSLNRLYGELTASYWIWKHDVHKVTGLFHYRRVLLLEDPTIRQLEDGELDVILPLPFLCFQDASWQYGRYLCTEDIDIMWKVLEEKSPECYQEARTVLSGPYLYNYNILVGRREVYQDYCQWLFPLLEEITERCEKQQRPRRERYIGRIGEILTSVYFLLNRKGWRIRHGEKKWIV